MDTYIEFKHITFNKIQNLRLLFCLNEIYPQNIYKTLKVFSLNKTLLHNLMLNNHGHICTSFGLQEKFLISVDNSLIIYSPRS